MPHVFQEVLELTPLISNSRDCCSCSKIPCGASNLKRTPRYWGFEPWGTPVCWLEPYQKDCQSWIPPGSWSMQWSSLPRADCQTKFTGLTWAPAALSRTRSAGCIQHSALDSHRTAFAIECTPCRHSYETKNWRGRPVSQAFRTAEPVMMNFLRLSHDCSAPPCGSFCRSPKS